MDQVRLPKTALENIKTAKQLYLLLDEKQLAEQEYDENEEEECIEEEKASNELQQIFDDIKNSQKTSNNEAQPDLLNRLQTVEKMRENVAIAQEKGAQKMLSGNNKQINAINIGDLVLFRVPEIERGPSDPNNLLCYVINKKHGLFQLASKAGVLVNFQSKESYYPWNTFSKTNLVCNFKMSDIPHFTLGKIKNKEIFGPYELKSLTVREAVTELSVGHGQGFIKCACKGQCKQISRCSCRAAGIACGSKCHGKEFTCTNNKDAPSIYDKDNLNNENLNDENLNDENLNDENLNDENLNDENINSKIKETNRVKSKRKK